MSEVSNKEDVVRSLRARVEQERGKIWSYEQSLVEARASLRAYELALELAEKSEDGMSAKRVKDQISDRVHAFQSSAPQIREAGRTSSRADSGYTKALGRPKGATVDMEKRIFYILSVLPMNDCEMQVRQICEQVKSRYGSPAGPTEAADDRA